MLKTVLFTRFGLQKVHNKMIKTGVFQGHYSKVESSKRKLVVLVWTGANGAFQKRLRRSYSDMTYTYKRRVQESITRTVWERTIKLNAFDRISVDEVFGMAHMKYRQNYEKCSHVMRVSILNPNMADEFFSHLLFPLNCSKATLESVNTCER